MLFNARLARRTAIGAIGTGAVVGAMFAATPSALADPPPNCTAGDLAQVASGVSAGTSVYLFTHPGGLRDQLNLEPNNPTLNSGGLSNGDSP